MTGTRGEEDYEGGGVSWYDTTFYLSQDEYVGDMIKVKIINAIVRCDHNERITTSGNCTIVLWG